MSYERDCKCSDCRDRDSALPAFVSRLTHDPHSYQTPPLDAQIPKYQTAALARDGSALYPSGVKTRVMCIIPRLE